jgi:hypothetical protein
MEKMDVAGLLAQRMRMTYQPGLPRANTAPKKDA